MAEIDVHALAAVMNKQMEREPLKLADNPVDHPVHYSVGGLEAIDAITAWGYAEGFNRGNAIKYIVRAGRKGRETEIEDLEKAAKYIEFEIERLKLNEK